jgi:hypothetical protein
VTIKTWELDSGHVIIKDEVRWLLQDHVGCLLSI